MSNLADIIQYVSSRTALKLPENRAQIIFEINNVWYQLWNSVDGPESRYTMSVQMNFNLDQRQVTFPYYVQEIRAARANRNGYTIKLYTPERYFGDNKWFQNFLEWRIIKHGPLINNINNATPITFTLADKTSQDVSISVAGATDRAETDSEIVLIRKGLTSGTTKKAFKDVSGCAKDSITDVNISGFDGDGTKIIDLPNCYIEAKNLIIQFKDPADLTMFQCTCFEVLFEARCPYLFHDSDQIPEPFDKVLQNKVIANLYLSQVNAEGVIDPRAEAFAAEGRLALDNMSANNTLGQSRIISVPRNEHSFLYYGQF